MNGTSLTHVARLAREGVRLAQAGKPDDEKFQQLAAWLLDALESDATDEIAEVQKLARAESAAVDRYLTRAMRVVAGAQSIHVLDDVEEWLHLLAVPMFFHPKQHRDVSEVLTHLECRSELERSLEHALGLEFASIRFCDHPVSVIDLEGLSLAETRRVAQDLLQQGDSAYLTPPVVDVGSSPEASHHMSLLWPAVWKVKESDRESQIQRISGSLHKSQALSRFKHRADELIEQELASRWDIRVRADVYMPALFHDVFAVFRLVELNLMLNQELHRFKGECTSVGFGLVGNRLRYLLMDAAGKVLTSDELKAPDEALETISAAVRAACARHGVACTATASFSTR
jgi:hypothetical protein